MFAVERVFLVLLLLFMGSQVVVPLMLGKRLFPLFRRSTYEERRLRAAREREERARRLLEAHTSEAQAAELERRANLEFDHAINAALADEGDEGKEPDKKKTIQ